MNKKLLLLTNGHGEDVLGAVLWRHIKALYPDVTVDVFPLVGRGDTYVRGGIPICGVQRTMPSGGFVWEHPMNLIKDLRAGLAGVVARQWRYVTGRASDYSGVIALGDVYPLILAAYAGRGPCVFVPTAKSDHIAGHYGWEARMMRRRTLKVFPRDELTAQSLRRVGVNARFVGNLMMDALPMTDRDFRLDPAQPCVALLPGTRLDASINLEDLLLIAKRLHSKWTILLSIAPSVNVDEMVQKAEKAGWRRKRRDRTSGQDGDVIRLGYRETTVLGVVGHFGDVLNCSDVVIGLAGTGNEQAAGLGKPVVTFPGRGTQFTPKFARAQQKLLGEAVCLKTRDHADVAAEVIRIVNDASRYRRMAETGRGRMGPPGAGRRMASRIGTLLLGMKAQSS